MNSGIDSGYWQTHTTVAIPKPLRETLDVLAKPGERVEDVIRRLAQQVTITREGA
jgi:predicted transcriptional regulator